MTIDFNILAQETFELTKNLRESFDIEEQTAFDFSEDKFLFQDEVEFEKIADELPEGPGLLYFVDKGISTFCIRAFISEDLFDDYESLKRNDPTIIKGLRLKDDWSMEEIKFFPTKDLEMAEMIFDQMVNRRFPKNEAALCNLSDPGFSWWMKSGLGEVEIFYQSHGIERDLSLIQLGPLGDPLIAWKRLSKGQSLLRNYFPLIEFSSTEKAFCIKTTPGNDAFLLFQKIFSEGRFEEFEDVLSAVIGEEKTLFQYLKEVASLRSFWLSVLKEL